MIYGWENSSAATTPTRSFYIPWTDFISEYEYEPPRGGYHGHAKAPRQPPKIRRSTTHVCRTPRSGVQCGTGMRVR